MATAWIKEFLHRETFHQVSYVSSILWILLSPFALILAPLVVPDSTSDYRCNGEAPVRDKCFSQFKQYYKQTSAGFLVRYFGTINSPLIMAVFLIYSLCMKSKLDRINSQANGILMFCAYCLQLASRFVLHISAIVLFGLLYFKSDLNFECHIKTEGSDWVHLLASNNTGEEQTYECFIYRETSGLYLTLTLIVLNGLFALVTLTEIIWMLIQSRGHCMKNEEFLRYLNTNPCNGGRSPLLHSRDEQDNPGPSVTVCDFIKSKMNETRLDLRYSKEFQGDEVALVLRDEWINQEDKTNGYKLSELVLGFTKMTDKGAKYISDALKNDNCKLTQLYLDGNNIGSSGAKHLSDALTSENCELTLLTLGEDIADDGVEHLRNSLTHSNCKLAELHISGLKIGNLGASYLSIVLIDPDCKLTKLYLHGNSIGNNGANDLAQALKAHSCKLLELTLVANQMGDTAVKSMYDALQDENCNLNLLCLEGNQITGEKYLQKELIGKTTVSVGPCRKREPRTPMEKKTKQMIAKTGPDKSAKPHFSP